MTFCIEIQNIFRRFIRQYRLPQHLSFEFIDEIRLFANDLGQVPLEIQVLCVLNFLALGSYQM